MDQWLYLSDSEHFISWQHFVSWQAKKCLYERVIVPTALYGAEVWGMRTAERRKVNVLEMKCLRSLVRVSRIYRVRNEEVHKEEL